MQQNMLFIKNIFVSFPLKRLINLLVIPILLQSCSTMYIPTIRTIPLLEKQGEIQMEAGVSTNSIYANISGAITDDFAVSLNGNLSYRNFTHYYDVFTHKDDKGPKDNLFFTMPDLRGMFAHRYMEVSVGKINIRPTFPMKLEIFGGTGMGRATDFVEYSSNRCDNYEVDYYSIFGQGNLGLKKRIIEAGASLRLVYTMFNYLSEYEYSSGEQSLFQYKFGAMSFEPMGFARIGRGNLKAVLRIGFNFMFRMNLNQELELNRDDTGYYHYRGLTKSGNLNYTMFHYSVGLSYRIGGNKNKIQ